MSCDNSPLAVKKTTLATPAAGVNVGAAKTNSLSDDMRKLATALAFGAASTGLGKQEVSAIEAALSAPIINNTFVLQNGDVRSIPNLPPNVDPLIHPTSYKAETPTPNTQNSAAAQDTSASVTNTPKNLATKEQEKIIAEILNRRDPGAKLTSFTVTWNEESREYTFSLEKMGSDGKLYHTIREIPGKSGEKDLAAALKKFQENISTGRWKVAEEGGLPKDTVVTSAKPAPNNATAGNNVNVEKSEITRHDSTRTLAKLGCNTCENSLITKVICTGEKISAEEHVYIIKRHPSEKEKDNIRRINLQLKNTNSSDNAPYTLASATSPHAPQPLEALPRYYKLKMKIANTNPQEVENKIVEAILKGQLEECDPPSEPNGKTERVTVKDGNGESITCDISTTSQQEYRYNFTINTKAGPYTGQYHSEVKIIGNPREEDKNYLNAVAKLKENIEKKIVIEASSQKAQEGLNGVPAEPVAAVQEEVTSQKGAKIIRIDDLSPEHRDIVNAFTRNQTSLKKRFTLVSIEELQDSSKFIMTFRYSDLEGTHNIRLPLSGKNLTIDRVIKYLVDKNDQPNPDIIRKLQKVLQEENQTSSSKEVKVDRLANNPNLQKPFTLATGKAGVDNLFLYDEKGYKYVNEHFYSYADAPALRDHIINANNELRRFAKEKNLPSINITDFGVSRDGGKVVIVFKVGSDEYALEGKNEGYISFDGVGRARLNGGHRSLCYELEKVIGRGNGYTRR